MKFSRLSRSSPWGVLGAVVALIAWDTPAHAVEPDNFRLNSTGDLLAQKHPAMVAE
jgi:hypothetical protein